VNVQGKQRRTVRLSRRAVQSTPVRKQRWRLRGAAALAHRHFHRLTHSRSPCSRHVVYCALTIKRQMSSL